MSNDWMKRLRYAVIDLETTRKDLDGEILEIGLILARMSDLEVVERWKTKVKPTRLVDAQGEALQVNGYNDRDWADAPSLREAMVQFGAKTKSATFVSYNAPFDVGYSERAFKEVNVADESDDGYVCLLKLAKLFIPGDRIENYKLATVCRYLGIPPEDIVHRAANGAELAYRILKIFHSYGPDPLSDLIS